MRRSALLESVSRRIDAFVPPALLHDSPEDARRVRLAVGIGFLMVPVFSILVIVHLVNHNALEAELNAVLGVIIGAAPFVLRATARFLIVINAILTVAYLVVVAAAVLAKGPGVTSATVALAEIPLFAILLGGVRVGALWAVLSVVTSGVIGALGYLSVIRARLPEQSAIYDDHATLVVITATLFLIGVMYEFRKDEALEHIATLEEGKRLAERERHHAETEAEVARAERLASMGRLAAATAHEINNPLSYVANNLQFLREGLSGALLEGEQGSALREAQDGVDRIRRIVAELGVLSRDEATGAEAVDAVAAVRTALKMAAGHTRPRALVVTRFSEVPPVLAIEPRLVQVVLNLVINAAQAIPEGHAAENEITVRVWLEAPGAVAIAVEDTGPGMKPAVLERVKDAFFTIKPLGEGTGLGLALADAIVRRFGGRLEIDSRDRGTIAKIVLPAADKTASSAPAVTSRSPEAAPMSKLRVLVIDDEPLVARAFARILRQHDVVLVGSGREGVARLCGDESFDLVFCDVMMPDLSGMGVFDALHAEQPRLAEAIVFMTGGIFTDRATAFRNRVPNTFIAKPIDARVVGRIIAERSAALELAASDDAVSG
jgi:signal transduction histidine kinase/CheY-like chemotaxis protein